MPENIKYTGAPTVTPEEARRTAAIEPYRLDFPQVRLTRAGEEAGQAVGQATKELGATMFTLGRSIDSLGQSITGAGTEMWNRAIGIKQLEAETKVNNATIAWNNDQRKRDEDFGSKLGENAGSQALQSFLKDSEDARQKVRNSFTSQYEQKLFDGQTTDQYIRSSRIAASHSTKEVKAQATKTNGIMLEQLKSNAIASTEDADFRAIDKKALQIFVNERKHLLGQNDAQVKDEYDAWHAEAIAGKAQRMAIDGDPGRALQLLQDNSDAFKNVDRKIYDSAMKDVKAQDARTASNYIADKAYRNNPDAGLDAIEEKARKAAEEHRPGDNIFARDTINQVRALYSIERQKQKDNEDRAEDLVSRAVHGLTPGQQSKTPQKWEEVEAVEGVREALGTLRRKDAFLDRMHRIVLDNAFGDRWADTPEAEARGRQLKGMYINGNPEFLDVKLEDEKLPRKGTWGKNTLLLNQMDMKRKGADFQKDPRVDRAFKAINAAMVLPKNLMKKGAEQDLFMSALWHGIEAELQTNGGKPLKPAEYVEIGKQLLATGEHGWFFAAPPAYRAATTPTSEYTKQYKADHPLASTPEIQFEWAKDHIRTLLKKEESKGAPKAPTITTVKTKPVAPP